MADELGASFGAGSTVALSWDAEQASPLG
jgi:hypothetical protein